jgi:hypothetical protein
MPACQAWSVVLYDGGSNEPKSNPKVTYKLNCPRAVLCCALLCYALMCSIMQVPKAR